MRDYRQNVSKVFELVNTVSKDIRGGVQRRLGREFQKEVCASLNIYKGRLGSGISWYPLEKIKVVPSQWVPSCDSKETEIC